MHQTRLQISAMPCDGEARRAERFGDRLADQPSIAPCRGRWRAAGRVCFRWISVILLAMGLTLGLTSPAGAEVDPLPDSRTRELAQEMLTASSSTPTQRQAAVEALLTRGGVEGLNAVLTAISPEAEPTARLRVLEALLAVNGKTPAPGPVQAAVAELFFVDTPLPQELGALLSLGTDQSAVERLIHAAERGGDPARRKRAVTALGQVASQAAAGALVTIAGSDDPRAEREAALAALDHLAGLDPAPANPDAWAAWWRDHQRLSPVDWRAMLARHHTHRAARLAERAQLLSQREAVAWRRVIDVSRQYYRASADDRRPDLLAGWLGDAEPALRRMAAQLCEERQIDQRPFPEPLREAMRRALADPVATVREGMVRRLHDLRDQPGAAKVAQRLADRAETDSAVLRASLAMMADLYQDDHDLVARAMALLPQPTVRGEAAGLLVSALDRGRVSDEQRAALESALADGLLGDQTPLPKVIELMGRLDSPGAWSRIAGWLESDDSAVRDAAARAWARSTRSLDVLANRVADPVIEPILLHAAAARGRSPRTLELLVDHTPRSETVTEWDRAVTSVAARTDPVAVARAAARLAQRSGNHIELRERMLSAAIAPLMASRAAAASDDPSSPADAQPADPRLIDLLLERTRVRLDQVAARAAASDMELIEQFASQLSEDQRHRLLELRIQGLLSTGALDEAVARIEREAQRAVDAATTATGQDGAEGGDTRPGRFPIAAFDRVLIAVRRLTDNGVNADLLANSQRLVVIAELSTDSERIGLARALAEQIAAALTRSRGGDLATDSSGAAPSDTPRPDSTASPPAPPTVPTGAPDVTPAPTLDTTTPEPAPGQEASSPNASP